jgi:DHA1 family bicyclomycin/chloramphenicol resistance-like MFS transporter
MIDPQKHKNLIVLILGLLATVTPFAIDMYLPAFTQIAGEFNTSTSQIALSVTSYFIGMALGQILYGPLLDRFGRKPPLYAGLSVFIIASMGCTIAPDVESLIAVRFFQALGGSVAWVAAVAMVRDFFKVEESAKIFSLLILIIGVSPLLAPTIGGFISTSWGWHAVFFVLATLTSCILLITAFYLPEGHVLDKSISLKPGPMIETFIGVIRQPQFYTYALSGAFAFATLFIYVAASPVIFMEKYQVTPKMYGGLFALLSVGFIGGSQVNILLIKKYKSEQLFRTMLIIEVINSFVFLFFAWNNWLGLYSTLFFLFIALTCVGIINPNGTALALALFTKNVGSASALIGCLQIGVAAIASGGVGLSDMNNTMPIFLLLAGTSGVALIILSIGRKKIGNKLAEASMSAENATH